MEEKVLKQFKTAVPFPLYIYRTNVKYNEVRKASGIAYIILDLLLKNASGNDTIVDVLLKFGIPKELHYIFGQEISNLISTDIISSRFGSDDFRGRYFEVIRMADISLTQKGRKMFMEGAIPTGMEKVKSKDIFYSPVTRKFDVVSALPYTDFVSSFLGIEFLDRIPIDISGMEDYINANATKIGLKAEERVVSFETEEPQKMQVRKEEGTSIVVRPSGVEFAFETTDETSFFYKYYSAGIMTECLLAKEKYKFVNAQKELVTVPKIKIGELSNLANVYLPSDMSKQAARPCKIFLNKNTFGLERNDNVIKPENACSDVILSFLDENAEFALLDVLGCKYYCPLNVEMPCQRFADTFEMQMLVENQASNEQFARIGGLLFDWYKDKAFDPDVGKVILYLVQALKDKTIFEIYLKQALRNLSSVDEKIDLILKMNAVFGKTAEWQEYFVRYGKELYTESMAQIKLDNMIYKNTVLSPLKEALNINDIDYVNMFASTTKETEDKSLVYQALQTAGFETNEILGVVNVVELYMGLVLDNERIDPSTELAARFETVRVNLWKLNDMLGIESYAEYTLKDDYNTDMFFNAYTTLQTSYKSIEKYKPYAESGYEMLKLYFGIYEPIHEILSLERTASSHPDKITVKYIDEYIARGKYKEAICDLVVKMQYDLRELLEADNLAQANELIDEAEQVGFIDSKQASALHKMRMCRNGFQHPERRQIPFDKPTIEGWRDIVFSLKGGSK